MSAQAARGNGRDETGAVRATAASLDAAEFAEYLRAERERRRLTLDDVAGSTKIAPHHLAALERGDVRQWPGGMYRRAMMRAYAESIGVDREFALKQFEQAFESPAARPEAPLAPPEPPHISEPTRSFEPAVPPRLVVQRPSPRALLAGVAAILGLAVGLGLWQLASDDPAAPGNETRAPIMASATAETSAIPAATPTTGRGAASAPSPTATANAAVSPVPAATAPATRAPLASTPQPTATRVDRSAAATSPAVTPLHATPPPRATRRADAGTATPAAPPAEITTRSTASDGNLVVTSEPAGARVTVNGIGWGETPVTIRHLPFGDKRIRVTMQGYFSQERVVRLGPQNPGARVRLTLRARTGTSSAQ